MKDNGEQRHLRQEARERYLLMREALATSWPLLTLVVAGFLLALYFVKPAPPSTLVMSVGREDGLYYAYAKRYQEFFARNGVRLELKTSGGSGENLLRLRNAEADIAFVQGGIASDRKPKGLLSLGSIFYEPLWVFVRNDAMPKKLSELAGLRVTVIQENTGARALAYRLLAANELGEKDFLLMPMNEMEAAGALQQGDLDALFVITSQDAMVVQVLLRSPMVALMSFSQAEAYQRRFPYLFRLSMPEGAVDLGRDYPPNDVELLAATANLVVREDLHPALQTLMLTAMREIHGGSGFFQKRGEFPAYKDADFPLTPAAERFYASGPPFLQRYMPFWMAVLADRFLILVIPLLTLLLPIIRFAPSIYQWRIRARLYRIYGELKFLESDLSQTQAEDARRELIKRLDAIEDAANRVPIPVRFSDLLYTLKAHINMVRKRANSPHPDFQSEHPRDEPSCDEQSCDDAEDGTADGAEDGVADGTAHREQG